MDNPKLSVSVCTYNRSKILQLALKSLVNQTVDKSLYEIIVVDNNSGDDTRGVVEEFIKKHSGDKMRYVFEKKQGLSYARNTGCRAAQFDWLAYLDDDGQASREWLDSALATINKVKPDILGGPVYPYYLEEKPKWFKDEYGTLSRGNKGRFLKVGEYLFGSNFIIKKNLLHKLGLFDPSWGMKGNKMGFGEETKLIIDARKKDSKVKVYYSPQIKVFHLVPKDKMSLVYKAKKWFWERLRCVSLGKRLLNWNVFLV